MNPNKKVEAYQVHPIILCDEGKSPSDERIINLLKDGWQPWGNPYFVEKVGYAVQAFVKYAD